jgi:hypothetical protein
MQLLAALLPVPTMIAAAGLAKCMRPITWHVCRELQHALVTSRVYNKATC